MKKKTIWIASSAAAAVVVLGGTAIAIASTDAFDDDRVTGTELDRASAAALAEVGEGTVTDVDRSDDLDHTYSVDVRLDDGTEVDVELDERFAVVFVDRDDAVSPSATTAPSASPSASGDADDRGRGDAPITDAERTAASEAALAAVGGGTVTEVERSDDLDHAFEVEIDLPNGADADVELDEAFGVTRVN